jgi:hypothetical protein
VVAVSLLNAFMPDVTVAGEPHFTISNICSDGREG